MAEMGTRRFSALTVLFSLFGGLITLIIGELILNLKGSMPEYFLMGLYFGVGAFVISAMIVLSQLISPQIIGYRWKEQYLGTSLKLFIPSTLILLGVSATLLQFTYGVQIGKGKQIKDIIIAVDTSGSMNETDPNGGRFMAVKELIDELEEDKRVALVTFDQVPSTVFDFTTREPLNVQTMKDAIDSVINSEKGKTEIKSMVDYTYDIIDKKSDPERGSSLIIVSDGEPTDGSDQNISLLTERYREKNIPIYTIGMMHKTTQTEDYLEAIANDTGGEHFSIQRTSMLKKTFEQIRYSQNSRNLLGERVGQVRYSLFYSVMRIILLTLLGGLIALGQGFIFDNRFFAKGLIIGGMTGAFLGGIALELLLKSGTNPILARCVFLFLFTLFLPLLIWTVEFKDGYHGTLKA